MKTNYFFLIAVVWITLTGTINAQYSNFTILESGVDQDYELFDDVNGDGVLDVVMQGGLACGGGEYLHIYHGHVDVLTGNYSFELVHTNYSDHGFFFYLMDMNGDGHKEVVSQETGNGNITIARFENGQYEDYILEDPEIDLTFILDIDNDGIDENIRRQTDFFYRGNFDDDFNYTETLFMEKDVEALSLYDYDKDGIEDYLYFKDDMLHILLIDGGLKNEITIPSENIEFIFADERLFYDVDQNGDVDFLYRPNDSNSYSDLYIAWNITANGFTQIENFAQTRSLDNYETLQYLDTDFDGTAELIIRDKSGSEEVLINAKTGDEVLINEDDEFESYTHYSTHGENQVVLASEEKYGKDIPLAVLNFRLEDGVFHYKNFAINVPDYSRADDAIKTDVNQNGTIDLMYKMYSSTDFGERYTIRWIENIDGTPSVSKSILSHLDLVKQSLFVDIDGDSDMDIVSAMDLTIYYNDGLGNFSDGTSLLEGMDSDSKLEYADLDANGLNDLVVLRRTGDLLFVQNTNGIDFDISTIISSENLANTSLQLVPVNSDALVDVVLNTNQNTRTFINEGNGEFTDEIFSSLGFTGLLFQYDIDQDGDVELFAEQSGEVRYTHYDENNIVDISNWQYLFSGSNSEEYVLLDVDRDGDMDFVTLDNANTNANIEWYEFVSIDSVASRGKLTELFPIPEEPYLLRNTYMPESDQFVMGDCDNLYITQREEETIRICIHADANSNSELDDEDYSLAYYHFSLSSNSVNTSFVTDELGCFNIGLPAGEYTFNSLSEGCLRFEDEVVIIDENTTSIDLLATERGDQVAVKVDLTSAPTRCGFTVDHWLTVKNETCRNGLINVEIELDDIAIWSSVQSDVAFNQFEKFLSFDISDLRPGESKVIKWSMEIPDFNFAGQFLEHKMKVVDDNSELLTEVEYRSEIRCAYDPNDKSISPDRRDVHDASYITDETISYLIRFQNVGNDTAFNIVIRDTLSANLDITSIRNVRSSHDYTYTLDPDSRLLQFDFEDIRLVDSIANEKDSHGFVKFDIRPEENLDDFERIDNSAGIYFDFNPPVITNTVEAEYVHDLSILTSTEDAFDKDNIVVNPNPASDYLEISGLSDHQMSLEIFSSTGARVYFNESLGQERHLVDTSIFTSGIYILKVDNGEKAVLKKIVIK